MTISTIIARLNSGRRFVDDTGHLVPEAQIALENLVRELNTNVDQANTDIAAAGGEGDLKTFGIPASHVWRSDTAGVFPAGDPTRDLVAVFYQDGVQVATRTIRGQLTSASGAIAVTDQANTGEATTINTMLAADSARVDITHTDSGAITSVSFTSVDVSVAGGSPATGGGK